MANLIGEVLLGQFRVDAFIASGGMGAVYRIWDNKRSVPLAMKVLQHDLVDDPTAFKYFQREARALQKLAHPNIVPFYGIYQTEDLSFILEEYIDGPNLRDIMRKHPNGMEIPEAMKYLKALCSALGYAHANQVIHCDIKPGNVMLTTYGQIYLADFGIARHSQSSTTTMASAGTPAYMAPEQIRGEEVSPATDIYELAIMFYEMLTGRRPFRGDEAESLTSGATSGERVRYAHLNLKAQNPSSIRPDIPQSLSDTILKALAKSPQDRYHDTQSFYMAVCQASGLEADAITTRVVVPPSTKTSSPSTSPSYPGIPGNLPNQTLSPSQVSQSPYPDTGKTNKLKATYVMLAGLGVLLLVGAFVFTNMSGSKISVSPNSNENSSSSSNSSSGALASNPTQDQQAISPTSEPSLTPTKTQSPTDIPTETSNPNAWGNYDLAFVSDRGRAPGLMNAFVMNLNNGSDFKELGPPPNYEKVYWPTFCGSKLAVEAQGDQKIYWYDQNSSTWEMPPLKGKGALAVPRCSPDGRYMAYSLPRNGTYDISVLDLYEQKFVYDPGSLGTTAGYASWASNTSFVFMTVEKPTGTYLVNDFGSPPSRIPINQALNYPSISPDGSQIAFSTGDRSINIANRDGSGIQIIFDGLSRDSNIPDWLPSGTTFWSPDNWIYFASVEGGDWDIFRIRPNGGNLENITRDWSSSNEMMPAVRQ